MSQVFPDRSPHPALFEVKHCQRPVRTKLTNWLCTALSHGIKCSATLLVSNRYNFVSLRQLDGFFKLECAGTSVSHGAFAHNRCSNLLPGCESRVDIEFDCSIELPAHVASSTELLLTVEWRSNTESALVPVGHVVACDQMLVSSELFTQPPHAPNLTEVASLFCRSDGSTVLINSETLAVAISKRSGALSSLRIGESELIGSVPLLQNFWRASTDNDSGGADTVVDVAALPLVVRAVVVVLIHAPFRWLKDWGLHTLAEVSYRELWQREGWDRLQPRDVTVAVIEEDRHHVLVSVQYALGAPGGYNTSPFPPQSTQIVQIV